MRSFSARRLRLGCALTACSAAALAAPSIASAGFTAGHCEGASIGGNGSTLQKVAMETWTKEFNNSALEAEGACGKAGAPTVIYTGTGSGPGEESWGNGEGKGKGNFLPENNFVGTDEPPNKEQKEAIEAEGGGGKLLTLPVLQAAVAVIVHLPKGCTVTKSPAGNRLVLSNSTLQQILHGTLTSWTAIKDGKEKLKGKKGACSPAIKRVARKEGSGTSSITKKYLNLEEGAEFPVECSAEAGGFSGATTWKKLAESSKNTCWPEEKADPVIRGKGGGGLVAEVAAHESSIGYANLADARTTFGADAECGTGGVCFWAELENGSFKKGKKTLPTFADPAANGVTTAKGAANCAEESYTDGVHKFPPTSTEALWNEVTTSLTEPHYTLCGFSYDLSVTKFSGFGKASGKEATDAGSRTASDFLTFVVNGGQKLLESHDYDALSEPVLKITKEGTEKISFS
jgi:ABC-type phosphate transport system substrate-binding protein